LVFGKAESEDSSIKNCPKNFSSSQGHWGGSNWVLQDWLKKLCMHSLKSDNFSVTGMYCYFAVY